jgi:AraC-like DNA-binding protein/quercetin dioxygenase-like cupin family protein
MPKSIEKWTDVPPTSLGDRNDPKHGVIGCILELSGGKRVHPHSHLRGQLIYSAKGPLRVVTETGSWSVPTNQAIWVPGGTEHSVIAYTSLSIHTLFIDPAFTQNLPQQCQVLSLSSLMRELVKRAIQLGDMYPVEGREQRLMEVIMDELQSLVPEPLYLPLAKERRVRRIMDSLMEDPADNRSLKDWASDVGASTRTLSRIFQREASLSFGQWRTRLRLLEGVERLQRGETVTGVALELGYANSSAFIAMFKRELGVAPSKFRRQS